MNLLKLILIGVYLPFLFACAETTGSDSTTATTTAATDSSVETLGTDNNQVTINAASDDIGNSPETGIISQSHFQMLFDPVEPKAIAVDGSYTETEVTVTVSVGGRNNIQITDGHIINFVTEKAAYFKERTDENGVVNRDSCTTINGKCSVTWVFSDTKFIHADQRIQIIAYTHGEEDFKDNNDNGKVDGEDVGLTEQFNGDLYIDLNGNGIVDGVPYIDANRNGFPDPTEIDTNLVIKTDTYKDSNGNGRLDGDMFIDANNNGLYDAAELFVDANENGSYDAAEPFTDSNNNTVYDAGDTFTDALNNKYDIGEAFVDVNNNGVFDAGDTFTDSLLNGVYDIGEAFTDVNGNGVYDTPETYTDSNKNGVYDVAEAFTDRNGDGLYTKAEIILDTNGDKLKIAGEPLADGDGDNVFDYSDPFVDVDNNGVFNQSGGTIVRFLDSGLYPNNTNVYDFETAFFNDSSEPYLDLNHNFQFDGAPTDQIVDLDMYASNASTASSGDGVHTVGDGKLNILSAECTNSNFCSPNKTVVIWDTAYLFWGTK